MFVSRHRKQLILTIAAVTGLGLAWLIQPLLPPYKASARFLLSAPADTGNWDRHIDDWCRSFIEARSSARTGAVAARIHHPAGRPDEFQIEVSSPERGFSLEVVTNVVNEAAQTSGIDVHVVDPPALVRFSEPSPVVLLSGAALGLLIGFVVIHRAGRQPAN